MRCRGRLQPTLLGNECAHHKQASFCDLGRKRPCCGHSWPPADLGTPVTTNCETCRCTQPRLPCRSARSETFRLHVLDTQQSTQRRAASLKTPEAATDPQGRTGRCRIGAQATGLVVWVALRPAESQTRRSEPPFCPAHGIGNGCLLEASMSRPGSGCRNWLEGELRVFSAQSVGQSIVNYH